MHERRRHVRVETPVLVEFPNPSTMKTERSFTRDVSESGMRFPTELRFTVGQEIAVTMRLPFDEASFHATGEVIWVREISRHGGPQYEVGVQFKWIEDPDRQRLIRHINNLCRRT